MHPISQTISFLSYMVLSFPFWLFHSLQNSMSFPLRHCLEFIRVLKLQASSYQIKPSFWDIDWSFLFRFNLSSIWRTLKYNWALSTWYICTKEYFSCCGFTKYNGSSDNANRLIFIISSLFSLRIGYSSFCLFQDLHTKTR